MVLILPNNPSQIQQSTSLNAPSVTPNGTTSNVSGNSSIQIQNPTPSGGSGSSSTVAITTSLTVSGNTTRIAGSLSVDGDIITNGSVYSYSDERLKMNMKPIDNALDRIEKLNGVYYQWKDYNKGDKYEIGLLAQNVQEEFPELVNTDKRGILTVEYSKITAILIESIKELKQRINELQK